MQRQHACGRDYKNAYTCLPCRLQVALRFVQYGEPLFNFTPADMMRMITQHSAALGFGADRLTWKAFRTLHATHSAVRGSHISAIMQAGEWKSKAFHDYCELDTIDAEVFLNAILGASDNEGDD